MGLFDFLFKRRAEVKSRVTVSEEATARTSNDIIPVEKRVKKAVPSSGGLYPHEVLVLNYAHTFHTGENTFQQFWWYKYGIKDVKKILDSLLERGYIAVAPVTHNLEKEKVVDLKQLLEKHGKEATGRKAVLVQRIVDEIPSDILDRLFPERYYILTTKGEVEIQAEAYVLYIHRHTIEDLDIWKMNRLMYKDHAGKPYDVVLWGYLNQRSTQHFAANDFGLYRNCRHSMAVILREAGEWLNCLSMLAEVVYFDLTGLSNNYDPRFLHVYASSFFPYDKSIVTLFPGIIAEIGKCQEQLGLSDQELRDTLAKVMNTLHAPQQLFTVEECISIFFYERDSNKKALVAVYQGAEKRFNNKYPNLKKNKLY